MYPSVIEHQDNESDFTNIHRPSDSRKFLRTRANAGSRLFLQISRSRAKQTYRGEQSAIAQHLDSTTLAGAPCYDGSVTSTFSGSVFGEQEPPPSSETTTDARAEQHRSAVRCRCETVQSLQIVRIRGIRRIADCTHAFSYNLRRPGHVETLRNEERRNHACVCLGYFARIAGHRGQAASRKAAQTRSGVAGARRSRTPVAS